DSTMANPKDPNPEKKPTPPGKGKPPPGKPPGKPAKGADGKGGDGKAKKGPPPAKPVKAGGSEGGRNKLGQGLGDLGVIEEDQLWDLLEEARNNGQKIGEAALTRGLVNEDQLLQALAEQYGVKVANLEDVKPQPEAIQVVPETMATVYKVLPLSFRDKILTVVMADPSNMAALDDIRNFLGIDTVQCTVAPLKALEEAITKAYAGKEESIVDIIQQLESDPELGAAHRKETSIDLEQLEELADAAPVRKLINMVLLLGIKDHASDIHFEPFEDEYKMCYRCDGVLYEMVPPPRHLATAIASRIKV